MDGLGGVGMNEEINGKFDDERSKIEHDEITDRREMIGDDLENIDAEDANSNRTKAVKYAGIIAGAIALLMLGGSAIIFAQGAGCAGRVNADLAGRNCVPAGKDVAVTGGQETGTNPGCARQGNAASSGYGDGGGCCSGGISEQAQSSQALPDGSSPSGNAGKSESKPNAVSPYNNQSTNGGTVTKDIGDNPTTQQIEKAAIEWYAAKFGDTKVTAVLQDFGCHQQVSIKKGQKTVKELIYRNGVFEALPN
jgi:hypothetical protein